ncbi:hypothetical protein Psuf_038340 [Phytohabitans suffuscus]|uniref:Uncharacterized protein n=2 Tax=Phytohabitans suffuscus TaxID=624315 RepID=A0A6F8YKP9_9ACTN|nr:hypothetical protein Psuf_038340 [Phytohabitans suffuscus]
MAKAAFRLLRGELKQASRQKAPNAQSAMRALVALEKRYRAKRYRGAELGAVRVRRESWSTKEKEAVLDQVAKVIRDGESAQAVYGNGQLLMDLWGRGCLPEVERLCTDVEQAVAQGHSEEVKWLLATWIPRRASDVVSVATSPRLDRSRRASRSKDKGKPRARGPVKAPTRALVMRRGA